MKEMLGNLADGQIEFYKAVSDPIAILVPIQLTHTFERRPWRNGRELYPSFNAFVLMSSLHCMYYLSYSDP